MSTKDSLGDRMKVYENAFRHSLPLRMPLIIRVDGKAFHSYTKGCEKPFDNKLLSAMNEVAIYLCSSIQGAQMAYVQSDEISILVHNYKKLTSSSWFDNNIQKIVSVSAGMASGVMTNISSTIFGTSKLATFDSRAFVLPEREVCNYFIWRQQDATRNSIQMVARSLYSHKACNNMNCDNLQEMIFQKGINWNDLPTQQKRGRCIVKKISKVACRCLDLGYGAGFDAAGRCPGCWDSKELGYSMRSKWATDNEIPIFNQDRSYIEDLLKVEKEDE